MNVCNIVCLITSWMVLIFVCNGFEYISGCYYAYIENNQLVAPNHCISSYSSKTQFYYNYIYECNATNNDFFIQKIYSAYGDTGKCVSSGYIASKTYYRSDGYDFNCSNDRQDCSSIFVISNSCGGNGDYNDTTYICGTCLPPSATSAMTIDEMDHVNSTRNLTQSGSWQVICKRSTYYGNETIVQYDSSDSQCKYTNKATNTTYKDGCQPNGQEFYVGTCHMY